MPSFLCKIWRFVANLLGKIVDFVLSVLKKVVGLVVDAIDAIADSLFGGSGGILLLIALGVGAYFLLTSDKSREDNGRSTVNNYRLGVE